MATDKRNSWSCAYYTRKKSWVIIFESAVAATATAATTADAPSVDPAADLWSVKTNCTVRTPEEHKMAKYGRMKPAVEIILPAGKVEAQAAVLSAVADHPSLAPACKLARINSSKGVGSL
jgi:hypothetical protein